ncbi:MAG: response regulator [Deltaproteobacteria bacterium]|nr:response regulator [Deltaproteobacteria bacterium]
MRAEPVTILHVEDDDVDAMAIERGFRRLALAPPIVRAKDGYEALEILRGTHAGQRLHQPFVVLLDWSLPRMGGGELLARMRADRELRTAVVFVLTTSRDPADRLAAYELNVAGYLVKSDRTEELLPALAMIAQYGRVVELP